MDFVYVGAIMALWLVTLGATRVCERLGSGA